MNPTARYLRLTYGFSIGASALFVVRRFAKNTAPTGCQKHTGNRHKNKPSASEKVVAHVIKLETKRTGTLFATILTRQKRSHIRILVAPLDWGLGHTTRCIPLVERLLLDGHEVALAAEGRSAALLAEAFPRLPLLHLQGYRVRYSRHRWWQVATILLQVPKIVRAIQQEHRWLRKMQRCCAFDMVISDNRYGLYHRLTPALFITHQLRIPVAPAWMCHVLQRLNYRFINRFGACAVPDKAAEYPLSGHLGHPHHLPAVPVHYIGWLSRLALPRPAPPDVDFLFLLSGPEPQRSLLEQKLLALAAAVPHKKCFLLRALPGGAAALQNVPPNVAVANHAAGPALSHLLGRSRQIISRSGYTTVMEMMLMGKKMICIPTPGQGEQEYLGQWLMQQGWAYSFAQHTPDYLTEIEKANVFHYRLPAPSGNDLAGFSALVQMLATERPVPHPQKQMGCSHLPPASAPLMS